MSLVLDNRADLAGKPGLHALIVGVSGYPHLPVPGAGAPPAAAFGMYQLSSTSLAAYRVYRWLLDEAQGLPVPLATCRLLLSPSADELAAERKLAGLGSASTLDNFLVDAAGWRTDASSSDDNVTLFYFAGHGVQRTKDDAVLLLEGFGDGIGDPLRHAVEIRNIVYGMAAAPPDRPHIAQTQFYFVDACRNSPDQFKNFEKLQPTAVFAVEVSGADKRCAPVFYAAAGGTQAQGIPQDQTVFSHALLDCLRGAAGDLGEVDGEERWHISVHTLSAALELKVDEWKQEFGADQDYVCSGLVKEGLVRFLDGPPKVDVVLAIEPPAALPLTRVEVRDDQGALLAPALPQPLDPHPYTCQWPAGYYTISARIEPPQPGYVDYAGRSRPVKPPRRYNSRVRVTP